MRYKRSFCIFLFTFFISCNRSPINVYDGFETKDLNKIWGNDRMVKEAFQTQSDIVRSGHSAAKITLKTGDVSEAGNDSSHASERDELVEVKELWSDEEKLYEYKFSLFLADSFPVVPVRLVIAQWKQKCPHKNGTCSDNSPVMAVRYVSGRLYITLQTDTSEQSVFQTKEEIRNKWLDFRFKIRFSRTAAGQVDAWLNEKQIINFRGVTCYSSKRGYPDRSKFYFKTGLYRNVMTEPMTIYIDEYSKKEIN